MECTSHGGVLVKQSIYGRFGRHRQREACTGLSTACSGPDQLAAVEGAAPAAFEGALPEEGAAPGTTGNIG